MKRLLQEPLNPAKDYFEDKLLLKVTKIISNHKIWYLVLCEVEIKLERRIKWIKE